ncbi:MAG: tetratricopeptide repeat protein [Myxococcaceae bacterium]|nr:MAG: tetratricopeptide repeat protein [Myxococcaceae bacterium]
MLRTSTAVPVLVAAALLGSCVHVPTEKERQGAEAHYDLGINAQNAGDVRSALKEFEESLKLDPEFADAHNAIAVLLHLSFDRKDEAEKHYKQALEIRPAFSEAKVNLGNLYLDQGRLDEAIGLYEQALNDMLYATPYIAEANLGWAYFKKGNSTQAVEHLRASVNHNPQFCLAYKDLGLVQDARGDIAAACTEFTRFVQACPKVAEAHQLLGSCQVRQGRASEARASFDACVENATGAPQQRMREQCIRLRDGLGGQGTRP